MTVFSKPEQLLEQLQVLINSGTTIVFPTDITARYWQKKLMECTTQPLHDTNSVSTAVMWNDSIVAWDVFKTKHFFSHLPLQPISRIERMIFAYKLAYQQVKQRFLTTIMQERNPIGSTSIQHVVFLLPYLEKIISDSSNSVISKQDAQLIYAYYIQYMDTLGVYEPFWNRPSLKYIDRVAIFFVGLIHDINYFQSSIESQGAPTMFSIPAKDTLEIPKHCTLSLFHNSLDEVIHHATNIRKLIDDGVNPHDIHVSTGDIQSMASIISVIFSRYTIPHTLHTSVKVADTLFGAIIRSVLAISMHDASYFHMRELIENHNIPLKNRDQLSRFLSTALRNRQLYDVYLGEISKSLKVVARARSFAQLKTSLTIFFESFIDNARWSTQELHEISFGLNILDTLTNIETLQDANYTDALKIFLEILDNTVYRAPRINSGVNVYGMPIAAGIYPPYHFIMNVSSKSLETVNATRKLAKQYNIDISSFSHEQSINKLLHVYSISGEKVHFSCSYQHASTAVLPYPPLFTEDEITTASITTMLQHEITDIIHPITPTTDQSIDLHYLKHATSSSSTWFSNSKLTTEQSALLNDSYKKSSNANYDSSQNKNTSATIEKNAVANTIMHISIQHLRVFQRCAYGLLFELMCRPHHTQHDIDINNYTGIGSVIHRTLSLLLNAQKSTILGSTFQPPPTKEIREYVAATGLLASYQEPMLHDVIVEQVENAITILIEQYSGWSILQTDVPVSKEIPNTLCRYSGSIDLLLQSSSSSICTIIDFKRSAKSIAHHTNKYDQLLYYTVLAQHQGIDCRHAWYVLLSEQKLAPTSYRKCNELFSPNSIAIQEMQTSMEECAHAIANGDYRVQNENGRCNQCNSIAQCRKYNQQHSS